MIKNIAINASILDDQPTGLGVYTINVINNLIRILDTYDDIDVTVFSPIKDVFNDQVNVKLISKLVMPKYKLLGGIIRFLWNQIYLTYIGFRYHIIYCPTHHGSLFLSNQIITVHDLISLSMDNVNSFQKMYFKLFLGHMIKRSIKTIAISNFTKSEILKQINSSKKKIDVIYNGINSSIFNHLEIKRQKQLISVGPTYPHKNFERLILAYSYLPKSIQIEYPLIIVGGYKKYVRKLKVICHNLAIEESVIFKGYITLDELVQLYRTSTLFIYPSLYEGFGLPPLEAMACGCPCLISNSTSLPEICYNSVDYFDPLSIHDITSKILIMLNDEKIRLRLVPSGIRRAKSFSWEQTASELSKYFTK